MAIDCDKDELENVEKFIDDNLSSIQETIFQLIKFNFMKREDNKFLADQMYANWEFIVPYKFVEIYKYWRLFKKFHNILYFFLPYDILGQLTCWYNLKFNWKLF
jgi:hypothetical protein